MRKPLTFDEIRSKAIRAAAAAAGLGVMACSGGATGNTAAAPVTDTGSETALGGDTAKTSADSSAAADTASAKDSGSSGGQDVATTVDAAGPVDAGANKDIGISADVGAAKDAAAPVDVAKVDTSNPTGCPDLETGEPDCEKAKGTPDWAKCCDDRMKWCQAKHGADQQAVNTCQFGANFSGKCTGCIPWGPPAPPRFDESWMPTVVANGMVFEVA